MDVVVVTTATIITTTEIVFVAIIKTIGMIVSAIVSATATNQLPLRLVLVFARPGQEVPSAPPVLWVQEVFRGLPAITAR